MGVLTKILFRRDTSANWTSVNPTLSQGEPGYDTTNKVLKIGDGTTAWSNLGYPNGENSARAFDPTGGYFTGSLYTQTNVIGNALTAPDTAALSITGDIDIIVKATATNWLTPSGTRTLAAKWTTTGNQRSYSFYLQTGTGKLVLETSADGTGTTLANVSSVNTGLSANAVKWVRATLDVNDGAGNRICKFYTSDDGSTWTQLGTTITTAGATSIFDSTAVLTIANIEAGASTIGWSGNLYRVTIKNGYDGAGTTVFDADFTTPALNALALTESSANAAVVTLTTTRYTYGIPNGVFTGVGTHAPAANTDYYNPFVVTAPLTIDMVQIGITGGVASAGNIQMAVYAADSNFQPTGSPLVNTTLAVATSATGTFRVLVTPVTLQPGTYVTAWNASLLWTFQRYSGGGPLFSTTPANYDLYYSVSRTNAAFTSSPSAWTTRTAGNANGWTTMLLRWSPA